MGYHAVSVKGRELKTPAGNVLAVPSDKLAQAIMKEWETQQGPKIRKDLLRLTPLACVAIDLVGENREAVLADIVPYIDTDLVCYRAGDIPELFDEQRKLLDPVTLWVHELFGIELAVTRGLMPVVQSSENSEKLTEILKGYDGWKLAAYAAAVKPLGSAVLALALVEGRLEADEAFRLAHLEEAFETEKWGVDDEKETFLAAKKEDVRAITQFMALLAQE